jgi:peptide/nickel transport system substrate-binding protein
MRTVIALQLALMVVAVSGCAVPASRPSTPSSAGPAANAGRTLVMASWVEPTSLSQKEVPVSGAANDGGARAPFNAGLTAIDAAERVVPYLAEAVPELNTESWTVSPDGRMETAYRLRPDARWHDGAPLTADDFVFASQVYQTPELGYASSLPISEIEEIVALDARTVLIRWRRPYPDADRLTVALLPALPKHLLEEPFTNGPLQAFTGNAYWTTQYVGLGPWQLVQWEPGTAIEGVAFAQHVLGKPKIERIRLRFMSDANTVLSNVLAGEIQLTFPFAIYPEQGQVLRQQGWNGVVLNNPSGWRRVEIQHRPDFVSPRAIADVRVRRAFAFATDRQAMNETAFLGENIITDTPIPASAPYAAEVARVTRPYAYDPRQADQLLGDAGFTKGSDGIYSNAEGRLAVEVKTQAAASFANELGVMADAWQRVGLEVSQVSVPLTLSRNPQVRGSFPAFYIGEGGVGDSLFAGLTSRSVSRPENNWAGSNRGGYANPEFDRLYELFSRSLVRAERDRYAVEMARILNEDVAAISLYFSSNVVAVAAGLTGPSPWGVGSAVTWNMAVWDWS